MGKLQTASYRLGIVGFGIHGGHLAGRVIRERILQPREVVAIDPFGAPFVQWRRRAANCGMPFLRSPSGHGIDDNLLALRRLGSSDSDFTPPYHRPATDLFERQLLSWEGSWLSDVPTMAARLVGVQETQRGIVLELDNNTSTSVESLVLCVGPPEPYVPDVLRRLGKDAPVHHVHDDPPRGTPGSRVAIVGGGIAAAHLALSLSADGVDTHLWYRDPMPRWQFDSDPCFIGPRCDRSRATARSYVDERMLISRSRRPGSLPPDLWSSIQQARARGAVTLRHLQVASAVRHGRGVALRGTAEGESVCETFDTIVCATGFTPGPPAPGLVESMSDALGLARAGDGFPIPSDSLEWGPGIYVSGGLAELEIGPPARNIIGAHLAARRIIPALAAKFTGRPTHASRARRNPHANTRPYGLQTGQRA